MIDKYFAENFAKEWIEAWNSHDLERIFSHYTDDFEMSSPLIVERMNEPSGTLKGKDEIRQYWQKGLDQVPKLHFEFSAVLIGANSITILYKNQKNQQVAEVITFNNENKAISGNAHYDR
jgi:aryl-phospho-beta-D-glucosidase BglC (GH1 family)